MKETDIKETTVSKLADIGRVGRIDLNAPLDGRLEKIQGSLGNPYAYVSSSGIKVKINHTGEKPIDEALFEYFTEN
jgi:hypothetical protein